MGLTSPPASDCDLALRVHRMRVARGACWAIVFALLGASALTLLDAAAELQPWARVLGLALWLTAFGVLAWLLVVRRWQARWSRNAARAAEKELSSNVKAAAAVIVLLTTCLSAALCVPNASEHIRRVVLPWHRATGSQYRIVVTSKEPVVRSGDPVTLSAYIEKLDPSAPHPGNAAIIYRELSGRETSSPMNLDETGTFHASHTNVFEEFNYRIEIGGASTEWFSVTPIQAVEATDDSVLELLPPGYAAAVLPRQLVKGYSTFNCYPFTQLELNLRFSRPAAKAFLDWRPLTGGSAPVIPIALAPDRLSGTASIQVKQEGALRLITIAEERGKTLSTSNTIAVRVRPDLPPHFTRVRGVLPRPVMIRPGENLAIEFSAEDDIAIGEAAIEYTIGNNPSQTATVVIDLSGALTARASGRYDFDLPGKLRDGETVRYRIRASDIRHRDPDLKANTVYYPETGWAVVTVNSKAPPLEHQRIAVEHEIVRNGLELTLSDLQAMIDAAVALRTATKNGFSAHHTIKLDEVRERERQLDRLLLRLADEASLTPELRPIATAINDIAGTKIKEAAGYLRQAGFGNESGTALSQAIDQLSGANVRLRSLVDRNKKLGEARIDCKKIEQLLVDQSLLIERSKSETKTPPAELLTLQRELRTRLTKLMTESESIRIAVDQANKTALSNFQVRVSNLLAMLLEYDTAIQQLEADVRRKALEGIAANASKNAINAADLLAKLEIASRITNVTLPKIAEFQKVEGLITAGKTVEALTELQKLTLALNALAGTIEKCAAERSDAKQKCHQFLLWQDDLRTRLELITMATAANYATLPAGAKSAFRNEQAALFSAVKSFVPPPGDDLAKKRAKALTSIERVVDSLAGTGLEAADTMKMASDLLRQLEKETPSNLMRLNKTFVDFQKLHAEQGQIQDSTRRMIGKPDVTSPATFLSIANKLAQETRRQHKQLAAFATLDLPDLEIRRMRCLAALSAATADLQAGLPFDILASQAWLKWEFDRLKLVLDGHQAPDEKKDQMWGVESDLERVQRLAWNRFQAAKSAEKLNKKSELNRTESDDEKRQLAREIEELSQTRVGSAGQLLKQRVLEQYDKLKAASQPDHFAGLQKTLGDSLNELAAMMADIADLTTSFDRLPPKSEAVESDEYLGSKHQADELRALAEHYRSLRERLSQLADSALSAMPTEDIKAQQTRADEITRKAEELTARVNHAIEANVDPQSTSLLIETGRALDKFARVLCESKEQLASGKRRDAEKNRAEAKGILRNLLAHLAKESPEDPKRNNQSPSSGVESFIQAFMEMQVAEKSLGEKLDLQIARKAMQLATESLRVALASRMKAAE